MQVSASAFIHCNYCGRHTRVANFKKDICVKFIILRKEDEEKLELTAFGNALTGVCHNILSLSSDQEVAETLLALENIYVTYNLSSMVVSSIF